MILSSTTHSPPLPRSPQVLPQQVFQPDVLATFNGIASASGKLGAFLGVWVFEGVYSWVGMIPLMVLVGTLNVLGAVVSGMCIGEELWERQLEQRGGAGRGGGG